MARIGRNRRVGLLGGAAAAAMLLGVPAITATPVSAPAAATAPAVEPITPQWSVAAARDLLRAVDAAGEEGLRPRDYGAARLRAAIADGDGAALDDVANASANALAHDYALGRVGDRASMGWLIDVSAGQLNALSQGLQAAIADGRPGRYIRGLLPTDRRYVALRTALAETGDGAERDRLRANMERWRWMPRSLGSNYLYVNVPSYELKVMDGDEAVSTYTVVVGARTTPTPVLASEAPSLVVNPWWNVPQSIVKSSNLRPGRGGYIFKASAGGGYAVRQPPGPRNALGRLKINLVNDQAIYLHDTPAKAGFARDERALSHGCIRVKDIDRLAAELMGDRADDGQLEDALDGRETATLRLPRTWPVYLVYFTSDLNDAGQVVTLGDPYGRDAALLARLDGGAMQMAAR